MQLFIFAQMENRRLISNSAKRSRIERTHQTMTKKKEQQQQKQQHEKIELNGLEKLRVEHIFNCTWFVNNAFILRTCGVSSPLFWLGKKEITHTNTHTHRPCESVIFPTNFPCMYLRQLRACSIYYSRWYVVLVVCVQFRFGALSHPCIIIYILYLKLRH